MAYLRIFALVLLTAFGTASTTVAETLNSSEGALRVERVMAGLDAPWGLAFLPGSGFLVTERDGQLTHVLDGQATRVRGVPEVVARGQGGLLDVMVPRDFAQTRQVYLSYSAPRRDGAGTALGVARLSEDGSQLEGFREIFTMAGGASGGRHFGSRIVEASDGTLFLTIGDRGDAEQAQNLATHHGTVVRINRDGTVPGDNPFTDLAGAQPEIWSYGHRNAQGAAVDAQGRLWVVEHGARGGDEVNPVRRGANYGWPVISYGRHYSGAKIGEGTVKQGMEQPAHYWDPSIAPSGMMIYSGKLWPAWRGDVFVGSLKFDYISRLSGNPLREVEQIEGPETARVRDIREAPDGTIWFISVGEGAIYRLSPAPSG
ncbi:MAG: PQQ-dependent sugar dehydrogenase [Pseudomonadota bacterium]